MIDVIDDNGNCTVVVKDKNGKQVERLLLNKWKENEKYYEEKYGEDPTASATCTTFAARFTPATVNLPANVKSMQYKYDEVEVWY